MAETKTFQSQTGIVTGGSRGLGRGVVEALVARGMRVVALARDAARPEAAAGKMPAEQVTGDAADEITTARLLQDLRPDLVVLCAGALPLLRPFHLHTWETFSQNWEVDTKATFVWLRNALLLPMKSGGHVVVVSSAAAVQGSPLSGGYAGAKRMQWMLADYASQEVARLKLNIRIHCLVPTLNPNTDLGRATIAAYSARAGVSADEFAKRFVPALTPAIMGEAVVNLHENPERWTQLAYRISGDGLTPVN